MIDGFDAVCEVSDVAGQIKRTLFQRPFYLVEMTGFEPATSASRTRRSTKLSHISVKISPHRAMEAVWLGWKDLNPRNGGVRIHCLTAWLHPSDLTKTIIAYYFVFVKRFLKIFKYFLP